MRLLYFLLSCCPGQTCSWQWRVVPHCRAWNGVLHQYDGPHAHLRPPRGSARPEPGTEMKRFFWVKIKVGRATLRGHP